MRDAALRVIREIGVDTGGSNIQFAVNPKDGRMVVIEMNPRVSRSSALASKATGFPIAKIAAKLAVGYTLDEIRNDITRETPACFEPTIDYVVVKMPRFTFEKFPQAKDILTPQMKSVGEAMAIGRTFKESLQKAMRSLETGSFGFESKVDLWPTPVGTNHLRDRSAKSSSSPTAQRLWYLGDAYRLGMTTEEIFQLSGDRSLVPRKDPRDHRHRERNCKLARATLAQLDASVLRRWKQMGFADARIANCLTHSAEAEIRQLRKEQRRRGGVQFCRYLRRRISSLHALSLFNLRRRGRIEADASARRS